MLSIFCSLWQNCFLACTSTRMGQKNGQMRIYYLVGNPSILSSPCFRSLCLTCEIEIYRSSIYEVAALAVNNLDYGGFFFLSCLPLEKSQHCEHPVVSYFFVCVVVKRPHKCPRRLFGKRAENWVCVHDEGGRRKRGRGREEEAGGGSSDRFLSPTSIKTCSSPLVSVCVCTFSLFSDQNAKSPKTRCLQSKTVYSLLSFPEKNIGLRKVFEMWKRSFFFPLFPSCKVFPSSSSSFSPPTKQSLFYTPPRRP